MDTGAPITVPVGEEVLGRIFNVTGDPVDDQPAPAVSKRYPIHRAAPKLVDQDVSSTILETGIKVIDLICPFTKGGKVGAFGGAVIVPLLLSHYGLRAVTLVGFCCYAAGIATTLLVREPNGRALDDISRDLAPQAG